MKKNILIIALFFLMINYSFGQSQNAINIYSGYEYSSPIYGTSSIKSKENGASLGISYERNIKNNWTIAVAINYSSLFSKSPNFGFDFYKYNRNLVGYSLESFKYFGNIDKFFGFCGLGISTQFDIFSTYHHQLLPDNTYLIEKNRAKTIIRFPIIATAGCGYSINEKISLYTAVKFGYDISNFWGSYYSNEALWAYSLNWHIGLKYRF